MYNAVKPVVLKIVLIWALFAFLHYANSFFPNPVFAFLGEREGAESIFGHSKMNFWTYLIFTAGEFFVLRKQIADATQYWHVRLFSAVTYPWYALTFWMTASALYGSGQPPRAVELSFAFISLVFGAYLAIRIEQILDETKFRKATQRTIVLLFLMALLQYVAFEIHAPWWELFGTG